MSEHEVGGHKSSETPTVHANTFGINIRQGGEFFYTLHLVFHLNFTELTMGAALEVETAIARTAVVKDEEHIAAISHIVFPRTSLIVERLLDICGVRSTIDIDHSRIFLCGVEIYGFHQAVV